MGTYIPGPTPLVTSTTAGLIPAPPEGEPTGKVFTDALEWAEPPGGGSSDAGDLTSGTLSNERLSAKVMAAVNTTLWRNFT